MKIKIDEFRTDVAQPVEAPLDFLQLCALLDTCQSATPTARMARGEATPLDSIDHTNPAVAILLAVPGARSPGDRAPASFHAAAAACFNIRSR